MKKQLLLLFLALLPLFASAHDAEIDGIYYDFEGDEASATRYGLLYNSYSGSVSIPSTVTYNGKTYSVTSIGEHAFHDCSGLTSITIPNSVTYIGYDAFYKCSSLTSITIPNSVTFIGQNAFSYCSGLTSITIGNGVTFIGSGAFSGTAWFDNQPDGLVYAGKVAYRYKGTMPANTQIEILDGTLGIAGSAFYNCSGLTSITIPNSVTTIVYSAFRGCSGLTSITIPNSVTSIGENAFSGCRGLTSITIPNSVTSIGLQAFSGCSGLTSITIPYSVTSIGSEAFSGCRGLTSITIPNSVTSIGGSAFSGCKGLTSITIPNSVTSIGGSAFSGCSGLTSITIPNSVTSIGDDVFDGCSGLTSITVETGNVNYDSRDNCNAIIETATNTLIAGFRNTVIPNSVTNIGFRAFYYRTGLTSISIPESVTSIGYEAFRGCSSLTSITIPNSVTFIDEFAFYGCSNIADVYCYAEKVPYTRDDVFSGSSISSATLHVPASTIELYKNAYLWNLFKEIVAIEEDTPPITPQCAKPTIAYNNGKLQFSCDTEDVKYKYSITSTLSGESTSGTINLGTSFTVSVYATREGYSDSDTATAIIDMSTVGDMNGDGLISIADVTALVNLILGRN